MKIWKLQPIKGLKGDKDVFNCDCATGFIIRAETEEAARALAQVSGGDETWAWEGEKMIWTDSEYVECKEVTAEGKMEVIMRDYWEA